MTGKLTANRQPLTTFSVWLSKQRILPYKTRRSLIKRLHPAMLKDFSFETEFFGHGPTLRFRGNIVNYIDRLIYFCGAHEKYMLCLLRDYVVSLSSPSPVRGEAERLKNDIWMSFFEPFRGGSYKEDIAHESPSLTLPPNGGGNLTFLDIGANAGNHSLFMARLVDRVHAFEPYPRVRRQLEENLVLNKIGNVTVHAFGLGDDNKTLPFYAAPDSNLGAASFQQDHKQDNYYLGDMQIRRGDDVMAELGITPDIIKADVEGYEKFVLEGLKETLARDRPLLIVELSPTTRESICNAQSFAALFPPRYRFYYFSSGNYDTGRYRLAPFDYALAPKIQDVIAVPEERLKFLSVA